MIFDKLPQYQIWKLENICYFLMILKVGQFILYCKSVFCLLAEKFALKYFGLVLLVNS